jgi:hypothetical protein
MANSKQYYSLTLRRIESTLVEDLYAIKLVTNRPVYDLAQEAIEYWLNTVARPHWGYVLDALREEEDAAEGPLTATDETTEDFEVE